MSESQRTRLVRAHALLEGALQDNAPIAQSYDRAKAALALLASLVAELDRP